MKSAIAVLILFLLAASPVAAQKVHKWVDKDGNVHFGDTVPPEYADQVFGNKDPEANSATSHVSTDVDDEIRRRNEEFRRKESDRVLLQTYLSVTEIESVRDNRVEQLQAQDRLTQRYIDNLNRQLVSLESQAAEGDSGEDGMSVGLAEEIADTKAKLAVYQKELDRSSAQQEEIRQKFAQDIDRFRELKGLSPDS